MNDDIKWITYHGAFDFAYFLKLMIGTEPMPQNSKSFYDIMKFYFPEFVDIKYLCKDIDGFRHGGL